jgi:hypothetical protein
MGDALQHEVADEKAWHDLDQPRIAVRSVLNGLVEDGAREVHQRDIAGPVEDPAGAGVRRQDRQPAGRDSAADPQAVEDAVKLRRRAIAHAEGRNRERRQADVVLPQAKSADGDPVPRVLNAREPHVRLSARVHRLQRLPYCSGFGRGAGITRC